MDIEKLANEGMILHEQLERHFAVGTYRARIETTYIDRLQRAWDDMFEVCGEPLVKIIGVAGKSFQRGGGGSVQIGEGMVAMVNRETYRQLAKLDDPLTYYNYEKG